MGTAGIGRQGGQYNIMPQLQLATMHFRAEFFQTGRLYICPRITVSVIRMATPPAHKLCPDMRKIAISRIF